MIYIRAFYCPNQLLWTVQKPEQIQIFITSVSAMNLFTITTLYSLCLCFLSTYAHVLSLSIITQC